MQMLLLIAVHILSFQISFISPDSDVNSNTYLQFSVLLSIVLLMELAAAVAAYALQDNIKGLLAEKINVTMHQYGENKEATAALDFLQNRVSQPTHHCLHICVINKKHSNISPVKENNYPETLYFLINCLYKLYYKKITFKLYKYIYSFSFLQLHCCGYNGPEDWDSVQFNGTMDSCCDFTSYYYSIEGNCPKHNDGCISRLSIIIHRSALYIGTGAVAIALIQVSGFNFTKLHVSGIYEKF